MSEEKKSYVNLKHARTQEQVDVMTQIQKDGVCPFCMENFLTYHSKPIIHENESWIVTENMNPYEGSVHHFLFVHKFHCTMPGELPAKSRVEFFDLVNWVTEEFKILGGSILIRFGDMRFTGGSVDHSHAHLIVGDTNNEEREGLRVKVGYKKP
jgi:diadenosine tetraphosphate (Ap4A) HIT family hydrolase